MSRVAAPLLLFCLFYCLTSASAWAQSRDSLFGHWMIVKVEHSDGSQDTTSSGLKAFTFLADGTLKIVWTPEALEANPEAITQCLYHVEANRLILTMGADEEVEYGEFSFEGAYLIITDPERGLVAYFQRE